MHIYKIIKNRFINLNDKFIKKLKQSYIELYNKSKLFKNLTNSLGLGLGSTFFYGMSAGICPFCGQPIASHAGGLTSITVLGFFFGIMAFIFFTIKDIYEKIKSKLKWNEKRLSN